MSQEPAWMALARNDLGETERAGSFDSPRIVGYFRDVGHPEVVHDEVAWCAAFVGSCLERSGVNSTRSLLARSYLIWGEPIGEPVPGCIAVFERNGDPRLGHVGFFVSASFDSIQVLAGNQSNSVRIASIPAARLLGYRWPKPSVRSSIFEYALQHVLKMEGGWSNDPADPGGATNFGITIADYARYRRVSLDAANRAGLEADLRSISRETVRAIYRDRYWGPARCPDLPVAPAVMHFDAAVNHGIGRAIRMLQEAAGAIPDGQIGPATLAKVRAADERALIHRYAEIRRAAYRRLPIFARFGRGWLARVDATLTAAKAVAGAVAIFHDPQETPMIANEPKWWAQSLTVWGTLITALSTVLPIIGPFIGLDVSGVLIVNFGNQITHILEALGGLLGTIMAIVGRFRATAPLQQSVVTLKI
jgi:uncharacterized protein (TIGR02594 family)